MEDCEGDDKEASSGWQTSLSSDVRRHNGQHWQQGMDGILEWKEEGNGRGKDGDECGAGGPATQQGDGGNAVGGERVDSDKHGERGMGEGGLWMRAGIWMRLSG